MNVELFMVIILWLSFGYTAFVIIVGKLIWWFAFSALDRALRVQTLGVEYIVVTVSSVALWVYYFGS